LKFEYKVIN